MMRIKKIALVLFTGFALRLVVSCCDCPEEAVFKYTFDCIEARHLDNAGKIPVLVETGAILKEAYGLQLEFSVLQLACNKTVHFSGFNSAYAMSCGCPPELQYLAQDTISGIKIKTLADFDQSHPADSDISDLFKVLPDREYLSIQEFIAAPETIYYEKPTKDHLDLFLMQAPTLGGEFRFQVELVLSNGTILTAVTTPINLE
jgi:hypothetical protein